MEVIDGMGTRQGAGDGQEEKMSIEKLKEKYSGNGEKVYTVNTNVMIDDDTEEEFSFVFMKPKTASYDRYVKMLSNSATFSVDNIVPEQRDYLTQTLDEYPAMSISLADKLLRMLGLADSASVKKL